MRSNGFALRLERTEARNQKPRGPRLQYTLRLKGWRISEGEKREVEPKIKQ